MSRSYKKTPSSGVRKSKWSKTQANRAVRRATKDNEIPISGKSYRKIYDPWNIGDTPEIAPTFEHFCEEKRRQFEWYKMHGYEVRLFGCQMGITNEFPSEEKLREIYNARYFRK